MEASAVVSVVIPSVGRAQSLRRLLSSIQAAKSSSRYSFEIIVVCAGYDERALNDVRAQADRVILCERMPRVSAARNLGAREARGRFILFVDDDNIADPLMIDELVEGMSTGDTAVGAPIMFFAGEPEAIWCAGASRTPLLMRTIFRRTVPPSAERLPSDDFPNCFMVNAQEFRAVGGFDEKRFPQHYEESDLCRRLVAATGKKVYAFPRSRVWHDIPRDPMRQLHIKNAFMAFQCARARAVFTAAYGNRTQWFLYVAIAQWLYAGYYIGVSFRNSFSDGMRMLLPYLRGVFAGLWEGIGIRLRARS